VKLHLAFSAALSFQGPGRLLHNYEKGPDRSTIVRA
jgi:hypothetical protein